LFGLFARSNDSSASEAWAPVGARVYAVGDIHGRLDLLVKLQEAILADAEKSEAGRRVLIYVGDYVDRGPDSRGVIDRLIEAPLEGFETVHLLGNHEYYMMRFLEDAAIMRTWLMNGGDETLRSFGLDPFDPAAEGDRGRWLQRAFRDTLTSAELTFLMNLQWQHVEGDYLFVHAGIRPGVGLEEQDRQDLIWIRDPFLSSRDDFGKVVVHGHTPEDAPVCRANRIGIDTGAVYGGRLTALVLEADSQSFIQV
jgi:serine/threonine protein phosphatase 1